MTVVKLTSRRHRLAIACHRSIFLWSGIFWFFRYRPYLCLPLLTPFYFICELCYQQRIYHKSQSSSELITMWVHHSIILLRSIPQSGVCLCQQLCSTHLDQSVWCRFRVNLSTQNSSIVSGHCLRHHPTSAGSASRYLIPIVASPSFITAYRFIGRYRDWWAARFFLPISQH